jgi:hypothetical protein
MIIAAAIASKDVTWLSARPPSVCGLVMVSPALPEGVASERKRPRRGRYPEGW